MTTALAVTSSFHITKHSNSLHGKMMENDALNAFCQGLWMKMDIWVMRMTLLMIMARSATTSLKNAWHGRRQQMREEEKRSVNNYEYCRA